MEVLAALRWLVGSFLVIILLFVCLFLIIAFLSVPVQWFPTEGVWYCEENGMLLSFDDDVDSYVTIDGKPVECIISIERGSNMIFLEIKDEDSGFFEVPIFEGEQVALSPSILVIRGGDGTEYTFIKQCDIKSSTES